MNLTNGDKVSNPGRTHFEELEARAIREQLERLLVHQTFRNSKRYPPLLRYVVEQTLAGNADQLKERTLGIEVFGREADYDTNVDHIVRGTAGEIRKRIAQYYHEPGHESEIRLDLPAGSYVPEFQWPAPQLPKESAPHVVPPSKTRLAWYALGALCVVVLLASAAWFGTRARETALDRFWQPVVGTSNSVLLCLGRAPGVQPSTAVDLAGTTTLGDTHQNKARMISLGDAITLARLTSLFGAKGKDFQVRSELNSTLDDFRNGPAVLIGGFNNEWTMRLTQGMRFTFDVDPKTIVLRIKDRQNATANWSVDMAMPTKDLTADYALVSRVYDSTTQRMVVVAAGIGVYGTLAAGEFLTDPQYMEQVARQAPKGWQSKNMEIVLTTQVINGHSGPPRIVAVQYW
jgi:hypothetical protein